MSLGGVLVLGKLLFIPHLFDGEFQLIRVQFTVIKSGIRMAVSYQGDFEIN